MQLFEQMQRMEMVDPVTRSIFLKFLIDNVNKFRKADELFRQYVKDGNYHYSMFLSMMSGASKK